MAGVRLPNGSSLDPGARLYLSHVVHAKGIVVAAMTSAIDTQLTSIIRARMSA